MHRDQKIGLTLAVLVLGFAGAFCFRSPSPGIARPLALSDAAELDARIEQLPVRAYTQREGVTDELRPQPDSSLRRPPLPGGLADQVIGIGVPGTQQVRDEGGLVDLFPGPPEPLVIEGPVEPVATVGLEAVPPPTVHKIAALESEEATVNSSEQPQISPEPYEEPADSTPQVREESPPVTGAYVVKSGDTLSHIAETIFGDSRRYLDLYRANRDVLADPDDLPVGTTLRLP